MGIGIDFLDLTRCFPVSFGLAGGIHHGSGCSRGEIARENRPTLEESSIKSSSSRDSEEPFLARNEIAACAPLPRRAEWRLP